MWHSYRLPTHLYKVELSVVVQGDMTQGGVKRYLKGNINKVVHNIVTTEHQ